METIKRVYLENQVKQLNKLNGFDNPKYSTIGAYTLDGAYGGWQVQQYVNDAGGVSVISKGGYISKRELYYPLWTLLEYAHSKQAASV